MSIDLLLSPVISKAKVMEILTSPEIMADLFRTRLSFLLPPGATLAECRPTVLRKRLGSRQVLCYRLFFAESLPSMMVVVKRYADKSEGERTYAIMRMLWENGFNRDSELKIPEPFCYLSELRLLVQGKARGILLLNNLKKSAPAALDRMRGAARWLAKLHRLDVDCPGINPPPDDEAAIRLFVRRVAKRVPHFQPRLDGLACNLFARIEGFADRPRALVHGDFQCENIIVGAKKVTVVDLDGFCRSDPARDLGYFIAQTRTKIFKGSVSPVSVIPALRAFWGEYRSAISEGERPDYSSRTCVFAAIKCLESVYYVTDVLPGGDMEVVGQLIDDAERFSGAERVEEALELSQSSWAERG